MAEKKFLHFEDNEDGTTTVTSNLMDDDAVLIIPLSLLELPALITGTALEEAADIVTHSGIVRIPNNINE